MIYRKVIEISKRPYGSNGGHVFMLRLDCNHLVMRISGCKKPGARQACAVCSDPQSPEAIEQLIFQA